MLYGIAGAGLLGVLVVLALFAFGGSSSADAGSVRTAMEAAGCTLTTAKAQKRDHSIANPDDTFKWNTTPPTSGPHYEGPAIYGAYTAPLQLARVVHNLEHGAVYIMYGDAVPDEEVAKLRAFYDDDSTGMLLAPLPSLKKTIALGVWVTPSATSEGSDRGNGYLAKCTAFDEAAFSAFRDELRFQGPERFPPSTMEPGA